MEWGPSGVHRHDSGNLDPQCFVAARLENGGRTESKDQTNPAVRTAFHLWDKVHPTDINAFSTKIEFQSLMFLVDSGRSLKVALIAVTPTLLR
jgi:hypothetical protein